MSMHPSLLLCALRSSSSSLLASYPQSVSLSLLCYLQTLRLGDSTHANNSRHAHPSSSDHAALVADRNFIRPVSRRAKSCGSLRSRRRICRRRARCSSLRWPCKPLLRTLCTDIRGRQRWP
eukprot:6214467-Pleurochrysis_carterae.AAC.2